MSEEHNIEDGMHRLGREGSGRDDPPYCLLIRNGNILWYQHADENGIKQTGAVLCENRAAAERAKKDLCDDSWSIAEVGSIPGETLGMILIYMKNVEGHTGCWKVTERGWFWNKF